MLIYESEGFLEIEAGDIKHLVRSTDMVPFGETGPSGFEVQAALCDYLDNSRQRCTVAFYTKALKRALLFSVKSPDKKSPWQHGQEVLAALGFQLEDVNLKLSPAMLEVVLRDVPGVVSPADARKQRTEKALLLSELNDAVNKDPDSPAGKKAALKLNSEKRIEERTDVLRQILVDLLTPSQEQNADFDALMEQVQDLSARLESAEANVLEERKQREMSESITAAAEKRIQELEELLVDVETKSASELKQKRKVLQLQGRIKELEALLESSAAEIQQEKEHQQQFIADVKSANEQIVLLQEQLKNAETTLAESLDRLAEEEATREDLETSLTSSSARIKELEDELEKLSEQTGDAAAEKAEAVTQLQQELAKTQQDLQEAGDKSEELSGRLTEALEEAETLKKSLAAAEQSARDHSGEEDRAAALNTQLDQANNDLDTLREELQHEGSVRKRLEKGAAENEKRIRELEEVLQNASAEAATDSSAQEDAQVAYELLQAELHELKRALREEQSAREDLEHQLDQAHKMIDSLETMVRETAKGPAKQEAQSAEANQQIVKLEAKLELLSEQLDRERARQEELANAVVEAERKLAGNEAAAQKKPLNKNISTAIDPDVAEETEVKKPVKSGKPLPHEVRPAPAKGAFFHPDWDLEGLPCQSAEQVFKAWETVFNVQISLDGYPSQYCMAFLIVLRVDKVKKLYMLFRLKQSKHTLVKVPAKVPKNENDLQKAIGEGLKFLKTSGFDMQEMPVEYVDSTLGSYFLEK